MFTVCFFNIIKYISNFFFLILNDLLYILHINILSDMISLYI